MGELGGFEGGRKWKETFVNEPLRMNGMIERMDRWTDGGYEFRWSGEKSLINKHMDKLMDEWMNE